MTNCKSVRFAIFALGTPFIKICSLAAIRRLQIGTKQDKTIQNRFAQEAKTKSKQDELWRVLLITQPVRKGRLVLSERTQMDAVNLRKRPECPLLQTLGRPKKSEIMKNPKKQSQNSRFLRQLF
jgi:hypothetical protein